VPPVKGGCVATSPRASAQGRSPVTPTMRSWNSVVGFLRDWEGVGTDRDEARHSHDLRLERDSGDLERGLLDSRDARGIVPERSARVGACDDSATSEPMLAQSKLVCRLWRGLAMRLRRGDGFGEEKQGTRQGRTEVTGESE
jgi:hypothetical protein